MNEFLSRVEDVLGIPATLETKFRDAPGWCSLKAFGLLVMLENRYAVRMDVNRFLQLETIGDIYRLIGGAQ